MTGAEWQAKNTSQDLEHIDVQKKSTIPWNFCISSAVTLVASLSTSVIEDKLDSRIILLK